MHSNHKHKIVRTETKNKDWFRIWYRDEATGSEYPADVSSAEYQARVLEQKFQDLGYDMQLIAQYKEAVLESERYDRQFDED